MTIASRNQDMTEATLLIQLMELEHQVWRALQTADMAADEALLSEDFIGVYPSGFADRAEHSGQLTSGPSVSEYDLTNARLLKISPTAAVLSYRAIYSGWGQKDRREMFVSSIWQKRDGIWRNIFSQDTPVNTG